MSISGWPDQPRRHRRHVRLDPGDQRTELHWRLPAANIVTSAGCTGFATAPPTQRPAGLPTAAPGTSARLLHSHRRRRNRARPAAARSPPPTRRSHRARDRLSHRRVHHDRFGGLRNDVQIRQPSAPRRFSPSSAALALAGCGGGGSQSMMPTAAQGATAPANTNTMTTPNGTVPVGYLSVTLPDHAGARRNRVTCALLSTPRNRRTSTRRRSNSSLVVSVTPQDPAEAAQFGNLTVCYNLYVNGTSVPNSPPNFVVAGVTPYHRDPCDPGAAGNRRLPDHAVRRKLRRYAVHDSDAAAGHRSARATSWRRRPSPKPIWRPVW